MSNRRTQPAPDLAIQFALFRLVLDCEDEPIEVSVPWPADRSDLEEVKTSPMLRIRLEQRYGAERIAGKDWTIVDGSFIDAATAVELWPDDAKVGGKDYAAAERASAPRKVRRLRGS